MRLRYCNLTCVYVIFRKFINGNGEWKRLKVHWSIISFPFSRFQGKKRNTNLVCFFYPWAELLCLIKRINLKMQTHNIKWIHFFLLHFHLEKMHITCMKYEMFIQQFWYFLQTTKNKYVIKEKSIQPRLSFFLRLFFVISIGRTLQRFFGFASSRVQNSITSFATIKTAPWIHATPNCKQKNKSS